MRYSNLLIASFATLILAGCSKVDISKFKSFDEVILNGSDDQIALFLEKETDLNKKGISGKTFLINLIIFKKQNLAIKAIERGADFRIKDDRGLTALHYASANDNLEITKLLVSKGADINALSKEKYTPYNICDAFRAKGTKAYLATLRGIDTKTKYEAALKRGVQKNSP